MADPESVDISFSLAPEGTVEAFTKAVQDLKPLLEQAKASAAGREAFVAEGTAGTASSHSASPGTLGVPGIGTTTEGDMFGMQKAAVQAAAATGPSETASTGTTTEGMRGAPKEGYARFLPQFVTDVQNMGMKQTFWEGPAEPGGEPAGSLRQYADEAIEGAIFGVVNQGIASVKGTASTLGQMFVPTAAQAQGQLSGYAGGPSIGPFQSPIAIGEGAYGGVGPIGFSQAAYEQFQGVGQALPALMAPGYSLGEAFEIQGALQGLGYRKGSEEFDILEDIDQTAVERSGGALKSMSTEMRAQLMDQMIRFGGASQQETEGIFQGLNDAAAGARVSIDAFAEGMIQASEQLQTIGLTSKEGLEAAKQFGAINNLSPAVMGTLMESPMWQAQAMATAGLPPETQGLIAKDPSLFSNVTMDTINSVMGALAGSAEPQRTTSHGVTTTISATRQEEAMAANILGISPDILRHYNKNAREIQAQSEITRMSNVYGKDAREINEDWKAGRISDEEYRRKSRQLREGTGEFAGLDSASWKEIRSQITVGGANEEGMFGSGITQDQLARLEAPGVGASQRKAMLRNIIRRNAPSKLDEDPNKHTIGFTGYAERVLKEVLPGAPARRDRQRATNRGEESRHSEHLNSADTSAYSPGQDALVARGNWATGGAP